MTHITDNDKEKDTYMHLKVESSNIYCYPFAEDSPNYKIEYTDTSKSVKTWQHLACSFDYEQQRALGTYYVKETDYSYSGFNSGSVLIYPKQTYRFCISCDGTDNQKGIENMFIKDVRVWNFARKPFEIA